MTRILAISSQVARGHVGLSAIVPTLNAFGREVIALPTILLSNHPGHLTSAGERISPDLLRRMVDALDANGWLGDIDAVLTGYLPSPEHVAFAHDTLERIRRRNPGLTYLCDPIIGDEPMGVYIPIDAAAAIRDRLVPIADLVKCNRFELEWLSGTPISCGGTAEAAVRLCGWPSVAVTSLRAGDNAIENILIERGSLTAMARVEKHANVPHGTGDLLSALFLGHRLLDATPAAEDFRVSVNGVRHVVEVSLGHDELQLIRAIDEAAFGLPLMQP